MTTTTTARGGPAAPDPDTAAHLLVGQLLGTGFVRGQLAEARQARQVAARRDKQLEAATAALEEARQRAAAERRAADPEDKGSVPRWLAFSGAAALSVLDLLPAWMAAQSFNLDARDSDAVTLLIVVALAGAMLILERAIRRGRRLLAVKLGVGAGFALLFALRVQYLAVTGSASLSAALLESAGLTAVSALLVGFGAVLLGHRVAKRAAQAARVLRTAEARHAETTRAADDGSEWAKRAWAALDQSMTAAALGRVPEGVSPAAFLAAVRDVVRGLLEG